MLMKLICITVFFTLFARIHANNSSKLCSSKKTVRLKITGFNLAKVYIGTPPQKFTLKVNTGSSNLYVPSKDCKDCFVDRDPNTITPEHHLYYSNESSTYVANGTKLTLTYADSVGDDEGHSVSGYLSTDVVTLHGSKVKNTTFLEVTKARPKLAAALVNDGLIGLGLEGISQGVRPIYYNMFEQHVIDDPLFSVYLNWNDESLDSGEGELIFGGFDPKRHTGELAYARVVKAGYWEIAVDSIDVENKNFCKNCSAFFDSGTGGIGASQQVYKKFKHAMEHITGFKALDKFPCTEVAKLPNVTFSMGGQTFNLTGKDYFSFVYPESNNSTEKPKTCSTIFGENIVSASEKRNLWLFGGDFMSLFYTVYDFGQNRVGIARAVHGAA